MSPLILLSLLGIAFIIPIVTDSIYRLVEVDPPQPGTLAERMELTDSVDPSVGLTRKVDAARRPAS